MVHRHHAERCDTLLHISANETDQLRCCMFVDILRPSLFAGVPSAILSGIRLVIARFRACFYQHWTFIK